jgi:hypothetical protein
MNEQQDRPADDKTRLHYWVDRERLARWLLIRTQKDHMTRTGQGLDYTALDGDLAIAQANAMLDVVNLLLQVKESVVAMYRTDHHTDPYLREHVIYPLFAFYDRHRKALPEGHGQRVLAAEPAATVVTDVEASAEFLLESTHEESSTPGTPAGPGGSPPHPDQEPLPQPDQPKKDV